MTSTTSSTLNSVVNDPMKELLKCRFCDTQFDMPKILTCGNNICTRCIHSLKSSTFKCAYCQQEHKLSRNLDEMITNFSVLNLLKVLNDNHPSHSEENYQNSTNVFFANNSRLDRDKSISLNGSGVFDPQLTLNELESVKSHKAVQNSKSVKDLSFKNENKEPATMKINRKINFKDEDQPLRKLPPTPPAYSNLRGSHEHDYRQYKLPYRPIKLDEQDQSGLESSAYFDWSNSNDSLSSVVQHIKLLNNSYNQMRIDFNYIFHRNDDLKNLTTRFVSCSSQSDNVRLIYLYEKLFGRVKTSHLNLIQLSNVKNRLSVLKNDKYSDSLSFFNNLALNEKYIVIVYRRWHRQFFIRVLDASTLNPIKEYKMDNCEIENIKMDTNNEKVYFLMDFNEHKSSNGIIKEYEITNMKKLRSFGQIKSESRPFFIKDEVVDIKYDKIFVKYKNSLIALSSLSGQVVYKFNLNYIAQSKIIVLHHHDLIINRNENVANATTGVAAGGELEVFQVFNGYDKLSLYNNRGEIIVENKLRLNERFDDFLYLSACNRFGFINKNSNFLLID